MRPAPGLRSLVRLPVSPRLVHAWLSPNLYMRNASAIAVLAATLTSCTVTRKATFNESEYAVYAQAGTGEIHGQAFLRTRGGAVRYGAGSTVYLNPVTTYSREWYDVSIVGGTKLSDSDPRAAKYSKSTVADGEGRFKFSGLAPGSYYVVSTVVWEAPGTIMPQGGNVYAQVQVRDGSVTETVLTW